MYTNMLVELQKQIGKSLFEVYPLELSKIKSDAKEGNKEAKVLLEVFEYLRTSKSLIKETLK